MARRVRYPINAENSRVQWPIRPQSSGRFRIVQPDFQSYCATIHNVVIDGRHPRTLDDPELDMPVEEFNLAVRQGKYRYIPKSRRPLLVEAHATKLWGLFPRKFLVHQVEWKEYVLFVVFGTPQDVASLLGVELHIPPKMDGVYQPFILGWDWKNKGEFPILAPGTLS